MRRQSRGAASGFGGCAVNQAAKRLDQARVEPVPNGHGYIVALPNDGPILFQSVSEWECDMWLFEQRTNDQSNDH
jgi:hypothetical protein